MIQSINQRLLVCLTVATVCQIFSKLPSTSSQFIATHMRSRQDRAAQKLLKEILDLKLPISIKDQMKGARLVNSKELSNQQQLQQQRLKSYEGDGQSKEIRICGLDSNKMDHSCWSDSHLGVKPMDSKSFPSGFNDNNRITVNGLPASGPKKSELRRMLANFERLIDQLSARQNPTRSTRS